MFQSRSELGVSEGVVSPDVYEKDGGYNQLSEMVKWIRENLDREKLEKIEDPDKDKKIILYLIDEIGYRLPIESGYGNATISEQLTFWLESKDLFDDNLKRRKERVDLVYKRQSAIDNTFALKQELRNMDMSRNSMRVHPISKMVYFLKLIRLDKREKALVPEIEKESLFLDETEQEFYDNELSLEKITSRIDCKLPTVVAGHLLQDLGWKVSMLCANHPEHPTILASREGPDGKESQFLIDFDSRPSQFRAFPNMRKYNPRYITASRLFATKKGFISENDQWPLPFNEETFKKFDDWYVEKVRENKEVPAHLL